MIITIRVTDKHNPSKVHVFTVYKCNHVSYNQEIDGALFYKKGLKISRSHPMYALYLETQAEVVEGGQGLIDVLPTVTGFSAVTASGVMVEGVRRKGIQFKGEIHYPAPRLIYGTKTQAA